jgi:ferrous iron transport protein B
MDRKILTIALAGNPNCGKSTVFNNITGARQHVGNYPGVTVEKKEGSAVFGEYELKIIDLPGTYSLAACSADESVASDFVLREKPDVVVNIVDASNLERNLYLYTQLAELDVPVVIGLNMTDVARDRGLDLDYEELSRNLGRQVVPMVGSKNQGTKELLEAVIREYSRENTLKPARIDYGTDVNEELNKLLAVMGVDVYHEHPARWVAVKLLEGDARANELAAGNERLVAQAEKSRNHLRAHFGDEPDCLLASRRYGFISGVCTPVVRLTVEKGHDLSDRIDRFVLSRFLGIPVFAAVMYAIFWFTFTVSGPVVGWTEMFFEWLAGAAGNV